MIGTHWRKGVMECRDDPSGLLISWNEMSWALSQNRRKQIRPRMGSARFLGAFKIAGDIRSPDPIHRRACIAHLSAAERQTIKCACVHREAAMDRAASGLAAAERKREVDLLRKLALTAQSRLQLLGKNRPLSR